MGENQFHPNKSAWSITQSTPWPNNPDGTPVAAVGQPAVITTDLTDTSIPRYWLKARAGAQVFIRNLDTTRTGPLFYAQLIKEADKILGFDTHGWVDPNNLLIGAGRPYGRIHTFVSDRPPQRIITIDPKIAAQSQGGRFYDLLVAILHVILLVKSEAIDLIRLDFFEYISTHRPEYIARTICDAVSRIDPGLYNLFNSPSFTFDDIKARAKRIDSGYTPQGACIYLLGYGNITGDVNDPQQGIYGGQSISPTARFKSHKGDLKAVRNGKTKSKHYHIAEKASSQNMYLIMDFGAADTNPTLVDIAEQCTICLFQSYQQYIKDFQQTTIWQRIQSSVNLSAGRLVVDQSSITKMTGALMISLVQQSILSTTGGWGFTPADNVGCNDQSPLGSFETNAWIYWTRQELQDRLVFTRSRVTLHTTHQSSKKIVVDEDRALFLDLANLGSVAVQVYLHKTELPTDLAPGSKVYPWVEIMKDGTPHETPWARLPLVGGLEEHNRCNSIGIAIVYKDKDDNWNKLWLQTEVGWSFRKIGGLEIPGMMDAFGNALSLIRFFLQEPVLNLPAGDRNISIALVYDVTYDHLKQEIGMSRREPAKSKTLEMVDLDGNVRENTKSRTQIITDLQRFFDPANIDLPHGTERQGKTQRLVKIKCDTCYLLGEEVGGRKAQRHAKMGEFGCQLRENSGGCCESCYIIGRGVCTWSDASDLQEDDGTGSRRRDALTLPRLLYREPEPCGDPSMLMSAQPDTLV